MNAEQLATVLSQIADYSADSDIRQHIRQVAEALRGNGFIILNGPPQEAMRQEEGQCSASPASSPSR